MDLQCGCSVFIVFLCEHDVFVAGVHGLLSGANGGLWAWRVLMLCAYYTPGVHIC